MRRRATYWRYHRRSRVTRKDDFAGKPRSRPRRPDPPRTHCASGSMATVSAHTASLPRLSRIPRGSRASSPRNSRAPRTRSAHGPRASRVPIDPVQGARHDVLLCRVDSPGEGLHPVRPRSRRHRPPPPCLHQFVSHAAKEKGIGLVEVLGVVTNQFFVREDCPMIAAPVQGDVDGIPKGSHHVTVSPIVWRSKLCPSPAPRQPPDDAACCRARDQPSPCTLSVRHAPLVSACCPAVVGRLWHRRCQGTQRGQR